MGKVCSYMAVILFCLGLVGSYILGQTFGITLFVAGFLSNTLLCVILAALGEIIEKLTQIAENTKQLLNSEQIKQGQIHRKTDTLFDAQSVMDIPKRKNK